ncbi:N-acetylglucosamine-6-phosphate deacetylase [Allobranchiibius sp. CTAmp26]|uniref:N-acetylglucosamine-6-phosphate deacetylase n=1 Tax=Allobranchiibius sp. CTAmp26 TaxID=2815214 RepID=UPI001AA1ACAB|nr:N-acetylglucosamine-6-phosphate deacetylase [Allobranchiibius sp. CTAmp26]MBO1754542.1 N-acetylglucosamine-6-phosphate deacetylase [Allobranchiibius sp. CTAmp26]
MLVHAAHVLGAGDAVPDGAEGWVRIDGARVVDVGPGAPAAHPDVELADGWLAPGFVDIHCHGGDRGDFASADPDSIRVAARYHAANGTGAMLASLVTAPLDDLCAQLAAIAVVVQDGETAVRGAHLEGPFLSHARCGAQNPAHLVDPDVAAFERLVAAARGTLRMITVAPELPGALDLVRAARRHEVTVALGHTDATYEQCLPAIEEGATVATHLFNGMPPLHHRAPGPVGAALDRRLWCEVIADGVHLHPAALRIVERAVPDRLVAITDAISAAGLADGTHELGGQAVGVTSGVARLAHNGSLAGSTLTMRDAVRRCVDVGLSVPAAVRAATVNPSTAVGLGSSGRIAAGATGGLLHLASPSGPRSSRGGADGAGVGEVRWITGGQPHDPGSR